MSSFNGLRANTTTKKVIYGIQKWMFLCFIFFLALRKGSKDPKDVFEDPVCESLSEPLDKRMRVNRLSKLL